MTARECSCAKCHPNAAKAGEDKPLTGIEKAALEPLRKQYLARGPLDGLVNEVDADGLVTFRLPSLVEQLDEWIGKNLKGEVD